jgi:hypothetical protein
MATGDKALSLGMARERIKLILARLEVAENELKTAILETRTLQAQIGPKPGNHDS